MSVTLGNFFTTADGHNVLGGVGGSGLDTKTLLDSLSAAKGASATPYKDQITLNDKKSTALATFQQLLSSFQSASDALRNPPGVGNDADNVFKFTTGSVAAPGSDYFSITTQPGATLQSYTVSDISSVATAAHQSTGN